MREFSAIGVLSLGSASSSKLVVDWWYCPLQVAKIVFRGCSEIPLQQSLWTRNWEIFVVNKKSGILIIFVLENL
jgi:hypothetical protein